MNTQEVWLSVLQIVVPAILIVGGGALGWWKFIQQQNKRRDEREEEDRQEWLDKRLKFDEASWGRLKETLDLQSQRIDALEKEVAKLRRENELLREALQKYNENGDSASVLAFLKEILARDSAEE